MTRDIFLNRMLKMANPVLLAASRGELNKTMTVEQKPNANRERYTGLEAVGRLLCGMSAWFQAEITNVKERELRDKTLELAHLAIAGQTDPNSLDFADYKTHGGPFSQFLVDTALLSQAILRAPVLWEPLPQSVKENVIQLLEVVRKMTPVLNNWVLFSTETEILYRKLTGDYNKRYAEISAKFVDLVNSWYVGDGWYCDGPHFKTDYYNSLMIHPLLLDFGDEAPDLLPEDLTPEIILGRAKRHAEVLENLVAPDGTYIATGRSLAYRCGVFHLLAQLTWQNRLPHTISPAVAREVLYAVTEKTLGNSSYREDGFLNIGICRAQPEHGQDYVSTGSLYMASVAFLPLGISDEDEFWKNTAEPWTQQAIWENVTVHGKPQTVTICTQNAEKLHSGACDPRKIA